MSDRLTLETLRQHYADLRPNAVHVIAKALDTSPAELMRAVERGEVTKDQVILALLALPELGGGSSREDTVAWALAGQAMRRRSAL